MQKCFISNRFINTANRWHTSSDLARRDPMEDKFTEDTEGVVACWTAGHVMDLVDHHRTATRLAWTVHDVRHVIKRWLQQQTVIPQELLQTHKLLDLWIQTQWHIIQDLIYLTHLHREIVHVQKQPKSSDWCQIVRTYLAFLDLISFNRVLTEIFSFIFSGWKLIVGYFGTPSRIPENWLALSYFQFQFTAMHWKCRYTNQTTLLWWKGFPPKKISTVMLKCNTYLWWMCLWFTVLVWTGQTLHISLIDLYIKVASHAVLAIHMVTTLETDT